MRDGRIEQDSAAADHVGVVPATPRALDKAELLRMLGAPAQQMSEMLASLSAEEKAELSRSLSSWSHHLPKLPNGEESSRALPSEEVSPANS
jgi:hypothetical protein